MTLALLVLAGVAEGVGVASLLPLVAVLGSDGATPKGVSGDIVRAIDGLGIEPSLGLFLSVLVAGMSLKAVLSLIASGRVGRASADVATKMRLDLVDSLLAARWSYYVLQPVGRFSAALGNEASQAGEAYAAAARFAAETIQVVIYVAIVMLVSWKLGVLSLGVGAVLVIALHRFVFIAKRTAVKQRRHVRSMIAGLTDLLIGIKPMKAMSRHARFRVLFERDAAKIRRAQQKQSFAKDANKALQEPILALCLAIGLYAAIGIWSMPSGQVVVMAILLARTVATIGKMQTALQAVRVAQAGFAAIDDTIQIARAMRENDHGGATPTFDSQIEFRDVSFGFGDTEIIARACLTARRGELTTITGVSGAGKTTLVDLLLGLYEPSDGEILIDGAPLATLDLMAWRRMTGYVPQELMLFHDTLRTNVTLGQREFDDADVRRALEQAGAGDFVTALSEGLDTVVGERGTRLSGGQRQRISIARALIHRPRLLILDEATTALDPETEAHIVRNVVELASQTELTVLAISHQPAWAKASDTVIHLSRGRITTIDRRPGGDGAGHRMHALGSGA